MRDRLGPALGIVGSRYHRWIELPSVADLSEPEMMELLAWAQQVFLNQPAQGSGSSRSTRRPVFQRVLIPDPSRPGKPRLRAGILALIIGLVIAVIVPMVVLFVLVLGGGS